MRGLIDLVNKTADFFRHLDRECNSKKNDVSTIQHVEKNDHNNCFEDKSSLDMFLPVDYNEQHPVYYGYHDDKPDRWGHS